MNINALTAYLALSSGSYSGILRDMYAVHNLGLNPDLHTKLLANRFVGGTKELSGIPPLSFTAKGKPLTAWSITGNTVQNGTPTPDTPQEVKAVGDRTGNLYLWNGNLLGSSGLTVSENESVISSVVDVRGVNTVYFTGDETLLNSSVYRISKSDTPIEVGSTVKTFDSSFVGGVYDVSDCNYLLVTASVYRKPQENREIIKNTFMLNLGSTALPYEPYGYKIPVATRGKNLLKLKEVNLTIKGVAVSIKNNSITVKGTAKASGGRTAYLSENFVLQPGTYFISGDIVNGMVYCLTDISNGKAVIASSTSKFTLTEKTKVAFGLNFINGVSYDATVNVMLNEGDKILPYEPYHEPITTPIYLPTPLYSGEVMRSNGTIARSDGTTETFTAPQIPTINGTTVIDVDTAVKPESMTIKYRR